MENNEKNTIPSPEMISQSQVIAKGRKIRDIGRLVKKYGGVPSRWMKKSSPAFGINGEYYEFHWYEHTGIGRFEIKKKKVTE